MANLINNFFEGLNTILVLSHGIISAALGSLEETHLTTMCAETRQVTDFVGDLPHLAVLFHLLFNSIDYLLDLLLDLFGIL